MRSPAIVTAVLVVIIAVVSALALLVGPGTLSDPALASTFLALRGYRVGVAFLAGAALAVGGVLVQGLFRNPLASPSVLGTTAGASLGGQLALLALEGIWGHEQTGFLLPEMVLPAGCLIGALLSLSLLLAVTRYTEDIIVVLLTGFLLSSLFLSIGSFVTTIAQGSWELGRAVVAFTLGGVSGSGLRQVLLILPLAVIGIAAAYVWSRSLDVLLSGEEEARSLGLDVKLTRRWSVIWVSVLTAGAVAVGGNVAFVGLIVPHVVRHFVGVAHARVIPASALLGGAFLVLCDVLTRSVPNSGEIPLGVVTGLIGAPLFLYLLLQSKRFQSA